MPILPSSSSGKWGDKISWMDEMVEPSREDWLRVFFLLVVNYSYNYSLYYCFRM